MKVGTVEVLPASGKYDGNFSELLGKFDESLAKSDPHEIFKEVGKSHYYLAAWNIGNDVFVDVACSDRTLAEKVLNEFQEKTGIVLQIEKDGRQ